MPKTNMKLTKGWKRFRRTVDPKEFDGNARKYMKAATVQNGHAFVRLARKLIKQKRYAKNAPLTIGLKGSTMPLRDGGGGDSLFSAITSVAVSDIKVFVGIKRQDQNFDVAVILHEGVSIGVTQKMRNLFAILWMADRSPAVRAKLFGRAAELHKRSTKSGMKWKRLKPSTTAIVIPARPFIREPFEDAALRKKARGNWLKAYQRALAAQAKGA